MSRIFRRARASSNSDNLASLPVSLFPLAKGSASDLVVDEIYGGGRQGHAGDDPLSKLIGVSNSGGFRYLGTIDELRLLVLTTGLNDPDWPDRLDTETGVFTYYGDNKVPGRELHATKRYGNEILRQVFQNAHDGKAGRARVPPILVFASTGQWRDVRFLGLAVPGAQGLSQSDDLVAVWRTKDDARFQNYRAHFTILDIATISREWLDSLRHGEASIGSVPAEWLSWRETGVIKPLKSPRSIEWRSKEEQLPNEPLRILILNSVLQFFDSRPYDFEHFAATIVEALLPQAHDIEVTRPAVDGGRDAVGKFRIGGMKSFIDVDFAVEAKCYGLKNPVGVRDLSRLISRLRHRQFGVLVTTSYLARQAYQEIKEDRHPIIVISGGDISDQLITMGYDNPGILMRWLTQQFG